jgi:hypothetical protein
MLARAEAMAALRVAKSDAAAAAVLSDVSAA